MPILSVSLDPQVWFSPGGIPITDVVIFTWILMALIILGALACTWRLKLVPGKLQSVAEIIVEGIRDQVKGVIPHEPERYLPFVGTILLIIAAGNLASLAPGFLAVAAFLASTAAWAILVFCAVIYFGVRARGAGYFLEYFRPVWWLFPLNIISELSRTIALAIRLFGNVVSGVIMGGVILSVAPWFVPIVPQLLGTVTGLIQAYIFAILAAVFIGGAVGSAQKKVKGAEDGAGN